jgi:hypothetical protein
LAIVFPIYSLFSAYNRHSDGPKPAKFNPKRLPLTLIEPTRKILEKLVESGGYGNNPTDAARIIISKHIQDLDSQKKIVIFPPLEDEKDVEPE